MNPKPTLTRAGNENRARELHFAFVGFACSRRVTERCVYITSEETFHRGESEIDWDWITTIKGPSATQSTSSSAEDLPGEVKENNIFGISPGNKPRDSPERAAKYEQKIIITKGPPQRDGKANGKTVHTSTSVGASNKNGGIQPSVLIPIINDVRPRLVFIP